MDTIENNGEAGENCIVERLRALPWFKGFQRAFKVTGLPIQLLSLGDSAPHTAWVGVQTGANTIGYLSVAQRGNAVGKRHGQTF